MLNRTLSAASAIVVLITAASNATAQPSKTQGAGNECLSRPNAAPPRGSHWYYRIDRPTHRRCWYLGPEKMPVRKEARVERNESREAPLPQSAFASAETAANDPVIVRADGNPVAAANFSASWPAVTAGPHERDSATSTGNDGAEDLATAETRDGMPSVWPVLSAEAGRPSAPGLGSLLLFLATAAAFVAVAIQTLLMLRPSGPGYGGRGQASQTNTPRPLDPIQRWETDSRPWPAATPRASILRESSPRNARDLDDERLRRRAMA